MWHTNLWCQYGTCANWKIPVIHLEQVCAGLTEVKRMRFMYLNSNKNITKWKHGSMLKHTLRKHSTIRIHLSLTLYCTEHDLHGSTKCLLFHSPTVMKLKLLCLSVNGTLQDSGSIFKLPKRHDYWKRFMNHIPELPKGDSLLVYKGLILILPTIRYLVLNYI